MMIILINWSFMKIWRLFLCSLPYGIPIFCISFFWRHRYWFHYLTILGLCLWSIFALNEKFRNLLLLKPCLERYPITDLINSKVPILMLSCKD